VNLSKIRILQKDLYTRLLTLLYHSKAGHIGSCLSCLDILIQTLIFEMKSADQFVLSKGHAAPSLYVVLNHLGHISDRKLRTFHQDGTLLADHPPHNLTKMILFELGSLGHGLSLSCGMAHGLKMKSKGKKNASRVFCLISDGECNEGQVWEAAQYASRQALDNLIVLIDKNRLQGFGRIEEVMGDGATRQKWEAFGFKVFVCSGHDLEIISKVYRQIRADKSRKPKVVIFETVKGKGVSFMEDRLEWHYYTLTEELFQKAIGEIVATYES